MEVQLIWKDDVDKNQAKIIEDLAHTWTKLDETTRFRMFLRACEEAVVALDKSGDVKMRGDECSLEDIAEFANALVIIYLKKTLKAAPWTMSKGNAVDLECGCEVCPEFDKETNACFFAPCKQDLVSGRKLCMQCPWWNEELNRCDQRKREW